MDVDGDVTEDKIQRDIGWTEYNVGDIVEGDGDVAREGGMVGCRSRWRGFSAWFRGGRCSGPLSSGRSWKTW